MRPCLEHGLEEVNGGYHRSGRGYLHRQVLERKLCRSLQPSEVCRHTCDNPRCIEPEHLVPGTHQDNVKDRVARGRTAHGQGHYAAKLDEAQVRAIRAEYVPRSRVHGTRAISRRLGVSQWVVSHAIRGITWKEVV